MSEIKISYGTNIRPLFTPIDREHMNFMFDLWSYDDVKQNASEIHDALSNQRMPPGAPWPQDQIDVFKAWMDQGFLP